MIRFALQDINKKLNQRTEPVCIPDNVLFSLPDHLRTSYLAILSLGEASASVISTRTGKSRGVESSHLNQLTRMQWLRKFRKSKTVIFKATERVPNKVNNMQGGD